MTLAVLLAGVAVGFLPASQPGRCAEDGEGRIAVPDACTGGSPNAGLSRGKPAVVGFRTTEGGRDDRARFTHPEGLEESDFLHLLHLQEGRGPGQRRERALTPDSDGDFLACERRLAGR